MGVNARRWVPMLVAAVIAIGLAGCATFEESGLPGSAASMAHNQMMFVRENPQTFGHYRLISLARIKPDLEAFLRSRGLPDFLAETSNRGRSYYILYYLKERQAFASRTRAGQGRSLEFSGPYPVTDKEFETLDAIRRKQSP
jgi:hypothetical protein